MESFVASLTTQVSPTKRSILPWTCFDSSCLEKVAWMCSRGLMALARNSLARALKNVRRMEVHVLQALQHLHTCPREGYTPDECLQWGLLLQHVARLEPECVDTWELSTWRGAWPDRIQLPKTTSSFAASTLVVAELMAQTYPCAQTARACMTWNRGGWRMSMATWRCVLAHADSSDAWDLMGLNHESADHVEQERALFEAGTRMSLPPDSAPLETLTPHQCVALLGCSVARQLSAHIPRWLEATLEKVHATTTPHPSFFRLLHMHMAQLPWSDAQLGALSLWAERGSLHAQTLVAEVMTILEPVPATSGVSSSDKRWRHITSASELTDDEKAELANSDDWRDVAWMVRWGVEPLMRPASVHAWMELLTQTPLANKEEDDSGDVQLLLGVLVTHHLAYVWPLSVASSSSTVSGLVLERDEGEGEAEEEGEQMDVRSWRGWWMRRALRQSCAWARVVVQHHLPDARIRSP